MGDVWTGDVFDLHAWWNVDKAGWGDGPWLDEPDKVQWIDPTTDLDCLAVRNHHGAWCGYVGVPPGHPLHGQGYDDVDVDVHGGLTFASTCDEDAPEGTGICHVPAPGRPADVWWLGFDCGHAFDVSPAIDALLGKVGVEPTPDEPRDTMRSGFPRTTYKSLDYVRREVTSLAEQVSSRRA